MFWDDIKEIKEDLRSIRETMYYEKIKPRLANEEEVTGISQTEHIESQLDQIKELIEKGLLSEDEGNPMNRIHDKLNELLSDEKRNEAVRLATKTLDKFDDYMKNVDKLNMMVNEFKGLVSISRACLADKKALEQTIRDLKVVAEYALSFSNQQFKIDAIYDMLCKEELKKKAPKRKKKVIKEV